MNKNMYDLIIVGTGPAGVFAAYEAIKISNNKLKILLIDKGNPIEKRICPIGKTTDKCIKCKNCAITTGFAGSGAFSDAKLSLYDKNQEKVLVGGNLPNIIGHGQTKKLIDYCNYVYEYFGATKDISGIENKDKIIELQNKSKNNNIDLVNVPIKHLGTEKSRELYERIEEFLINYMKVKFNCELEKLIIENNKVKGIIANGTSYYSDNVILSMGRNGSDQLSKLCDEYNIKKENGIIDIGVRYELKSEKGIKIINDLMYEGKFVMNVPPFNDRVRTFCQNPDGFVTMESYDGKLTLVNGHAFKEKKSNNTNLAILSSHKFTQPFKDTIQFGRQIAKTTNDLSNGGVIIQRFGDLVNGKRTWEYELNSNSVIPTLKGAVPGDLALAFPYRTLTNIINFIKELGKVVEDFDNPDNLVYGPEIKFYSNKVLLNNQLMTSVDGLYAIGDGAGLTRGLMMASCSGVQVVRNIFKIG